MYRDDDERSYQDQLDAKFYQGKTPAQHRPRNFSYTKQLLELIPVVLRHLDQLDEAFTQKDRDLMRAYLASVGNRVNTAIAIDRSVKTIDNRLARLIKKLRVHVEEIKRLQKKAGISEEEITCPYCQRKFRRKKTGNHIYT